MYGNEIKKQLGITLDCVNESMSALYTFEKNNERFEGCSLAMNVIRISLEQEFNKDITSSTIQSVDFCDIMLSLIINITGNKPRILGKLRYEISELRDLCRKEVYQIPKVKENVSN